MLSKPGLIKTWILFCHITIILAGRNPTASQNHGMIARLKPVNGEDVLATHAESIKSSYKRKTSPESHLDQSSQAGSSTRLLRRSPTGISSSAVSDAAGHSNSPAQVFGDGPAPVSSSRGGRIRSDAVPEAKIGHIFQEQWIKTLPKHILQANDAFFKGKKHEELSILHEQAANLAQERNKPKTARKHKAADHMHGALRNHFFVKAGSSAGQAHNAGTAIAKLRKIP